jgi:glycosyltransferase involved in cell wall biosynthesis
MSDHSFSVVIPTYGEAPYLGDVLEALMKQTDRCFDILVVDNNEHPRARGICDRFGSRVAFLHCPQRGLSAARNAGIAATRTEYIAFLDDDGIPEPAWAAELRAGLRRYGCAAAGGRVELALERGLPAWYPERLRSLLSELRYDGVDIPALAETQYVVGANFCVARRAIQEVGGFRQDLGRSGSSLRSSEEVELCKRIAKAGGRVAFLAAPVVRHRIPRQRCTLSYVLERSIWQGRADAIVEILHGRPAALGRRNSPRNMLKFAWETLLSCGTRRGAVLAAADLVRQCGYLVEYVKTKMGRNLAGVRRTAA